MALKRGTEFQPLRFRLDRVMHVFFGRQESTFSCEIIVRLFRLFDSEKPQPPPKITMGNRNVLRVLIQLWQQGRNWLPWLCKQP
jgi:hypothetical protein